MRMLRRVPVLALLAAALVAAAPSPAPTPDHHDRKAGDVFRLQPLSGGAYALYGRGGNVGSDSRPARPSRGTTRRPDPRRYAVFAGPLLAPCASAIFSKSRSARPARNGRPNRRRSARRRRKASSGSEERPG